MGTGAWEVTAVGCHVGRPPLQMLVSSTTVDESDVNTSLLPVGTRPGGRNGDVGAKEGTEQGPSASGKASWFKFASVPLLHNGFIPLHCSTPTFEVQDLRAFPSVWACTGNLTVTVGRFVGSQSAVAVSLGAVWVLVRNV